MTDLDRLRDVHARMKTELHRVIVGQDEVIDQLLVALLAGGHCLLEGVPGLAKTLLVSSLSRTLDLDFHRIQFTPDLMPSDLTGTELLHVDPETSTRSFRFEPGPVFTNVVLADEINRTPPKTQAALLEAMVERQVTSAGTCHKLPDPFFVLATQNPIEQEGTYPLPEAQVDRFMLKLRIGYPSRSEEKEILKRSMAGFPKLNAVLSPEQLLAARKVASNIRFDDKLVDYILDLVAATRDPEASGIADLAGLVDFGGSPRATLALEKAARAHAFLAGRPYVNSADIKTMAPDVLRHRLVLSYEAEAEQVDADDVIGRILSSVPVP